MIEVATLTGRETIEAEVVGELFGVHRDLTKARRWWTVTHLGTGMAAVMGITHEAAALDLARRCAELGPEFWSDPKNAHFGCSVPAAVRRIMRRWLSAQQVGLE